jgi:hypothetical protein
MIGLIIISAVAFVLAAIGAFFGLNIFNVSPEAFSRASNNLALIDIALAVCFKKEQTL